MKNCLKLMLKFDTKIGSKNDDYKLILKVNYKWFMSHPMVQYFLIVRDSIY
jgi:hypothetical protein